MAEPPEGKDTIPPLTNPQTFESTGESIMAEKRENEIEDELDEVDQDRGIVVNASDMTSDMIPKKKSKKKRSRRSAAQRGLVRLPFTD